MPIRACADRNDAWQCGVAKRRQDTSFKAAVCSQWSRSARRICMRYRRGPNLFELLKPVSRPVALLATFFRLVFVSVASANMINHFAPLVFIDGAEYSSAFTPDQLQALAIGFVRLRTIGFDIALVFFGLHCLTAGYLFLGQRSSPAFSGSD